jgi:hypothetical protein
VAMRIDQQREPKGVWSIRQACNAWDGKKSRATGEGDGMGDDNESVGDVEQGCAMDSGERDAVSEPGEASQSRVTRRLGGRAGTAESPSCDGGDD